MSNTNLTCDSVRLKEDLKTYYEHQDYILKMIAYADSLLEGYRLNGDDEGMNFCNHEIGNLESDLEMTQAVIEDLEAALAELSGQEASTDAQRDFGDCNPEEEIG